MTENEVIEALKLDGGLEISGKPLRIARFLEAIDIANKALEEVQQYRAIGTVEQCREAVEKMKPKRYKNDCGRCKSCGAYNNLIINKLANPKGHPVIYCWNCGQAIDWSDTPETHT